MSGSISQKRPWLAALLTVLLTGLGHLYLRRWRRALGWLVISAGVSALFVDPSTAAELQQGTVSPESVIAVLPGLLVVALSITDAYLLAHVQNDTTASPESERDESPTCPHCRNDLDPDLEFCHWCTRPVDDVEPTRGDSTTEDR